MRGHEQKLSANLGIHKHPTITVFLSPLQVEEFGREMYKLFKLFRGKATRMKKERDLGQQVRRDAVQEEEVFAPLKMAETVQKQIGEFKVRL